MRYLYLLLSVLACGCQQADNQGTTTNTNSIDQLIEQQQSVYRSNVVVMVSQRGKLVYSKTVGNFNTNSTLAIASASKWLSAAVIMSLVDEGKLSLSDSVGKYLPIFNRYRKGGITLGQLFSHTSGFPSESPQGFEDRRDLTLAQAVDSIAVQVSLVAQPGKVFRYGGLSMHIAGRMAEVVSGKKWNVLFGEKIGIPCQMSSTVYSPLSPNNPKIAGGVTSSARDLLNFTEMMVAKGIWNGKRILSEAAVSQLSSDQTNAATIGYTAYIGGNAYTPFGMINPVRYGIGVWLDVVNPQTGEVLEYTSPGAFGTHPWVNNPQQLAGVIFTMSQWLETKNASLQLREQVRKAFP